MGSEASKVLGCLKTPKFDNNLFSERVTSLVKNVKEGLLLQNIDKVKTQVGKNSQIFFKIVFF